MPDRLPESAGQPGRRRSFLRSLWRHRFALGGALIVLAIGAAAAFASVLTRYDPDKVAVRERLKPPSRAHLLGTDDLGRDLFSRLLHGARPSLIVATASTTLSMVVGATLGLIAAFRPRIAGPIIMRATDVLFTFPAILFALALVTMLGPSLPNLIAALTVIYLPRFVRVVRASALQVRSLEYITSVHALGASLPRILLRHVLPNVTGPLIVQVTVGFSLAILAEASLSFLGLGVQPPQPSWGAMLNAARPFMEVAPWTVVFPTLAIGLAVLGFNLLGEELRDWLDPTLTDA
jgi:ABC-type dipeptide/oligopeptide/nickel transport system permease subunit